MQTVLYISPMELGDETKVWHIHEDLAVETLARSAGAAGLAAFIGSGFYALEITFPDGDFQEQFHRFLTHPDVARLLRDLSPHVKDLPNPDEGTAAMPLANEMFRWRREDGE